MTVEFAVVLGLFLLTHAFPMFATLRDRLVAAIGRPIYFGTFSVLSVVLLIWLFAAAARAPYTPLWTPIRQAPFLGMPVVFWLMIEGVMGTNALSLGRSGSAPHGLAPLTRHPLPLALFLWACLHILANPDLTHAILFGLLGGFSALSMVMIDRRKQRKMGSEWTHLARGSACFSLRGLPRIRLHWAAIAGAAGLYIVTLFTHSYFAGVPISPW